MANLILPCSSWQWREHPYNISLCCIVLFLYLFLDSGFMDEEASYSKFVAFHFLFFWRPLIPTTSFHSNKDMRGYCNLPAVLGANEHWFPYQTLEYFLSKGLPFSLLCVSSVRLVASMDYGHCLATHRQILPLPYNHSLTAIYKQMQQLMWNLPWLVASQYFAFGIFKSVRRWCWR